MVEDIKAELGGKPLDLYVMTHEHMDHVQGLLYAKEKAELELDVDFAWITASAAPGLLRHAPEREEEEARGARAPTTQIAAYLEAAPDKTLEGADAEQQPALDRDCVTYLRGLADKTTYVHRGRTSTGTHPFEEAKLAIWGPEEDTSVYYRSLQPLALGVERRRRGAPSRRVRQPASALGRRRRRVLPTSSTRAARACTTTCSRSTRPRTTRASSSRSSGAAGSSCSPATPSRRAGG